MYPISHTPPPPLVATPQKSLGFKQKKAGDTSSIVTQEQLDEKELEKEMTTQALDIFDPAAGATFGGNKTVVGAGTTTANGVTIPAPVDVNGDGKIDAEDSIAAAEKVKEKSILEQLQSPVPAQDYESSDALLNSLTGIFGGTSNAGSEYIYGTEANYGGVPCIDCMKNNSGFDLPEIDTSKIPGWVSLNNDSRLSDVEKCYSSILLNNAKDTVRERYGNREKSGGVCARGVRASLDNAGMNTGGGLGNAIDFQTSGTLANLGFRNAMDGGNDSRKCACWRGSGFCRPQNR